MKKTLAFILAVLIPLSVAATDNVGQCGLGSKLWEGKSGVAPQVMAITTNGWGFNTFAISSGTSGCTQDGVVRSAWKTAAYIDGNMNKLARDMSQGRGESLDTLASLMNVSANHQPLFASVLQENFGRIFASQDASSADVVNALRVTLASNATLSQYAVNI